MLLYIILAYAMLCNGLSNAVCLVNACLFFLVHFVLDSCIIIYAMLLVSILCFSGHRQFDYFNICHVSCTVVHVQLVFSILDSDCICL